jgi:hypothetical protein
MTQENEAPIIEGQSGTADTTEVLSSPQSTEVDYKVEYEKLTEANDKLEQEFKTLKGRQQVRVDGPDVVSQLGEVKSEMRRMRREQRRDSLENSYIDDDTKKASLQKLDDEERQEQYQSVTTQHAKRLATRLGAKIERAGIPTDNPTIQAAVQKWGEARTPDEYDAIFDDLDDYIEDTRGAALESTRQEQNRTSETLAVGATVGAASGVSPDWVKVRDAYIADPTDPKIQKAYYTMRQARGL